MIGVFSSDIYFENIYRSLEDKGIKVDFLVTEGEKPGGRGLALRQNPAYQFAKKIGLEVLTPSKMDNEFSVRLKDLILDNKTKVGFVYSYGKIISEEIINLFELGIINAHFSLLPRYRGSSPLQAALLNLDQKTGVTFFLIDKGLDTGRIIKKEEIDIKTEDNFDTLKKTALQKVTRILPQTIKDYISGSIIPQEQEKEGVSCFGKIKKEDGLISKNDDLKSTLGKIRAFSSWPKAYLMIDGKRIIIHSAKAINGQLEIERIQVEGKNPIAFSQFKNGYSVLLTRFPPYVKI
jgi:methionyl-tRNA formyltransferase